MDFLSSLRRKWPFLFHQERAETPLLPGVLFLLSLLFLFSVSTTYGQRLTVTPFLSLSERYDTNIFRTATDEEEDFVTVVSPGIRITYLTTVPTRATELNFNYRADFELFSQNSEQNQISQRGLLNFSSQLTPSLSLTLRDSLVITEEETLRVETTEDPTGLRPVSQQRRRRTFENRARIAPELRLGGRTFLGVLFESLLDDVDVPEEVDETRYSVGANLGYLIHVARGTRVNLGYVLTFHQFSENAPVAPGEERADFRVHTITAGVRHDFTPTLSGTASLGYAFTESDDPEEDNNASVVANVALTKTLKTGELSLRYIRSFTSGGGEGRSVAADRLLATFSSRITPKITAALRGNVSYFNFQQRVTPTSGGDRYFLSLRPSLTYEMLRFWQLSAAYTYELTEFAEDDPNLADREDQWFSFISRFTVREWLFLRLEYRYATRQIKKGEVFRGAQSFDDNQVMLTITTAPSFRF
ncbi:MAG: hypothetical protein D6736_10230 [Nitrospinota bacterium]|nr:MAG: hypothetical protein D6736_10230 [Nitrospinota bacterium]